MRCEDCDHRYRIKSAYVTRTVTTGPKTLDELDPLLRGDSVDLDQVEVAQEPADVAPVSIDADGNVVGLSGLSELMRQSDAAHAQAAAIARTRGEDSAPPPAGRVMRPAAPGRPMPAARPRRARPKKKSAAPMLLAGVLLLVFIGTMAGVVYVATRPAPPDPVVQDGPPATGPAGLGDPADLFPDVPGHQPGTTPDPDGQTPDPAPSDPDWITSAGGPEANPDFAYNPDAKPTEIPRPSDVPTVLTAAQPLVHEGWYVMTPPRLNVEATGVSVVELNNLEPMLEAEGQMVLSGELTNRGAQAVVAGEAHVTLLDSSGRVFAETYLPFAALGGGETQEVRLAIPSRYWNRAQDVRTRGIVFETSDKLDLLANVTLEPAGVDGWSSVRVTARNPHDRWLRDALVVVWAEDVAGRTVARYRAVQEDIYVDPSGWLDIVVHVPLETASGPVSWHAQVIQQ
ncbi:MAG: hypothetical protein ACIAXF_16885 [Phycisphaerales bacterium JB063]